MATVKHHHQTALPDDPTKAVSSSEWNEAHDVELVDGDIPASIARLADLTAIYQPLDADLTAIAGLVSAADRAPYFTGSGTAALATLTAAGRAIIDDADAAAQRTTLGLEAIGSAFPGGPGAGARCWRSDLNLEFVFDGTRWLSTVLFTAVYVPCDSALPFAAAASNRAVLQNIAGASDIWIETLYTSFRVAAGGTALDASNKWVGTAAAPVSKTITIDSGASAADRADVQAVGALLGANFFGSISWAKTGTPGALYVVPQVTYRIVAT